ncbi:MAG: hypothetical protein KBS76_07660, partial [Ruminococcus sp.]|nr:hypothetical protein [Candidatus Apopatosoma intestinale]
MKKNLKRILALWLVLAFAVIGIVGCASEVPEETTDSSATETTKTTGTTAATTEGSETTKVTETAKTTETETTPTGTTGTTGTVKPAETTSSSAETTGTTTPGKPEREEDVHILRLVYLGTDAVTLFEADLTGSSFLVKTDRPACAMDGTEFMPIYYRYDTTSETYTEKLTQNTLYTDIAPGHFYLTEEDG